MLIDFTQPAHNFVILSAALAESKDLRTSKSVRSYHYFDAFGIGSAKICDSLRAGLRPVAHLHAAAAAASTSHFVLRSG